MDAEPILITGDKNDSPWPSRPWLLVKSHGLAFEERRIPLGTRLGAPQEWLRDAAAETECLPAADEVP